MNECLLYFTDKGIVLKKKEKKDDKTLWINIFPSKIAFYLMGAVTKTSFSDGSPNRMFYSIKFKKIFLWENLRQFF